MEETEEPMICNVETLAKLMKDGGDFTNAHREEKADEFIGACMAQLGSSGETAEEKEDEAPQPKKKKKKGNGSPKKEKTFGGESWRTFKQKCVERHNIKGTDIISEGGKVCSPEWKEWKEKHGEDKQ